MSHEPDAVHFALDDYATVPRRIGAFVIDLVFVVLLFVATGSLVGLVVVPPDVRAMPKSPEQQRRITKAMKPVQTPMTLGWLVLAVAYHIPLRLTRGGTVGYRLAGLRLVGKSGDPPPPGALTKRFLIAVPGCLLFGSTYFACRKNPRRRAGHDQWAGTWVVRRRADPVGPARTFYNTKMLGTFILTYVDIEPVTSGAEPVAASSEKAPVIG